MANEQHTPFFDTVLRAIVIMLFAVCSAWAAWVSSATHTVSIRQVELESQMNTINYKLDLLLAAHELETKAK